MKGKEGLRDIGLQRLQEVCQYSEDGEGSIDMLGIPSME
jgi:hypothetical protein